MRTYSLDIQLDQLGKIVQGFLGLFPAQQRASMQRFGFPVAEWIFEAHTGQRVIAVFAQITKGCAERIGIAAFAQGDEQVH